jgi:ankyrin repeat protein
MAAAEAGLVEICKLLLDHGAPWNALDRLNKCAGNYATEKQHWDVVNLLVDAGTAAELLLGASVRLQQQQQQQLHHYQQIFQSSMNHLQSQIICNNDCNTRILPCCWIRMTMPS